MSTDISLQSVQLFFDFVHFDLNSPSKFVFGNKLPNRVNEASVRWTGYPIAVNNPFNSLRFIMVLVRLNLQFEQQITKNFRWAIGPTIGFHGDKI